MIKLSKMSDHALALAGALAREPGARRSAAEWAKLARVSEPAAAKILKRLAAAGICESARGKVGGYALRARPSEVSFLAVMEAVDGPARFAACEAGDAACALAIACQVKPHAVEIGREVRSLLSGLKLSRMASPAGEARHGQ